MRGSLVFGGWAGNAEKFKSKGSFDKKEPAREGSTHIAAQTFTFRELAAATKNFRPECLLGEGGFGRVYKGRLENTGQASGTGSGGNWRVLACVDGCR